MKARTGGPVGRWIALVALAVLLLLPRIASADVGDYRVTDASKIYLGNAKLFQRPCVISCDRVYREIPEYREILEKGLTDRDVRYHFLMKKASERFAEAVKQAAKDLDVDLVAELGSVRPAKKDVDPPPDRTTEVIGKLS